MRSRSSRSPTLPLVALAVVATALAGCGGGTHEADKPSPLPPRLAHLFDYDAGAPLGIREATHVDHLDITVRVVSYAAPGGRVPALLVVPDRRGTHGGVIFMHGAGGSRMDFLSEAAALAQLGAVVVTITSPFQTTPSGDDDRLMIRNVVDLRRAVDLLDARTDVDPKRIGLVGYSLGAQAAGLTAGVENRLRAVIIQAGRDRPSRDHGGDARLDTIRYVGHAAPAHLFFQGATLDENIPAREMQALIGAGSEPKVFKWYPTSHSFDLSAFRDQVAWLRGQLGLRRR